MPIQGLADRVVRVFTPTVIILAMLTFVAWLAFGRAITFALVSAVAVLMVACPCAMGWPHRPRRRARCVLS